MSERVDPEGLCDFHSQPFAEQFTLWAIRVWVQAFCADTPASGLLLDAFTRAEVPNGFARLDDFMTIVTHSAARALRIQCPCHCAVSEDEKDILHVLGRLQRVPSFDATADLGRFLKPTGIRLATEKARAFALVLMCGSIQFSGDGYWRIGNAERYVHAAASGSRLIH